MNIQVRACVQSVYHQHAYMISYQNIINAGNRARQ